MARSVPPSLRAAQMLKPPALEPNELTEFASMDLKEVLDTRKVGMVAYLAALLPWCRDDDMCMLRYSQPSSNSSSLLKCSSRDLNWNT